MQTPAVIEFRKPAAQMRLICTSCNASGEAPCDCGVPFTYVSAGQVAENAVLDPKNQDKSNVALAKEFGVAEATIRRARAGSSNDEPEERAPRGANALPAENSAPETRRVGRDGKKYPAKRKKTKRKSVSDAMPTEEEAEESYQTGLLEQLCRLPDDLRVENLVKLFAHLRRTYPEFFAAEIPVAPEKLAAQPNRDRPALGDLSQILKFIAGRAERAPKADRIDAARQILRVLRVAPEELGLNDDSEAAPSSPAAQDDGLDIPAFLRRTPDSGAVS
jgi:hypothetical protein